MPALNVAAQAVVEASAYGVVLGRQGNRGWNAAPQNTYPAAGDDRSSVGITLDHLQRLCGGRLATVCAPSAD